MQLVGSSSTYGCERIRGSRETPEYPKDKKIILTGTQVGCGFKGKDNLLISCYIGSVVNLERKCCLRNFNFMSL